MSSITIAQFRTALKAFEDSAKYPDSDLQFWLNVADAQILPRAERWGNLLESGIQMFVAHYITVDALMLAEGRMGGPMGLRPGAIASEGGDKVNVSFDMTSVAEEGGGHWNQTIWGKRFYRLSRMVGAGPVQVSPESGGDNVSASAWAGPLFQ